MFSSDLVYRLRRLDEDATLLSDDSVRFRFIIVGGSALILLGHLSRATHDIDAVSVPAELYTLLAKYDINSNAEAYINNFPYNFEDRLVKLPIEGQCIDFYTPCLEDLVIAKLCSARDTDIHDVEAPSVREHLDWALLDYLATDNNEAKASALNEWTYSEFLDRYHNYVRRWHSCGS